MTKSSAITLALAAVAAAQGRPSDTSICDYYTTALLKDNTAANQQALLTLVVNTAVIGNYTTPNVGIAVPGILTPNTFMGEDVNLLQYFDGELASTNNGGSKGVSMNFLDGGGAAPLMKNMPANSTDSAQYELLTHLYQYFAVLLGCSQYGSKVTPYAGSTNMYQVHKFMALSDAEFLYFVTQVGLSAASFGVTASDVNAVYKSLVGAFGMRCSPPAAIPSTAQPQLQAICIDSSCPKATNPVCNSYASVMEPTLVTTTGATASATSTYASPTTYAATTPVTQISDGQPQGPTGQPVTQISDGQPQGPTGAPITQISDGQPQAPTGQPITQISDGQPQAPTGAPVTQISDGQPQAPTKTGYQCPACPTCPYETSTYYATETKYETMYETSTYYTTYYETSSYYQPTTYYETSYETKPYYQPTTEYETSYETKPYYQPTTYYETETKPYYHPTSYETSEYETKPYYHPTSYEKSTYYPTETYESTTCDETSYPYYQSKTYESSTYYESTPTSYESSTYYESKPTSYESSTYYESTPTSYEAPSSYETPAPYTTSEEDSYPTDR